MSNKEQSVPCAACGCECTDGLVYVHVETNDEVFLCEICAEKHELNGYTIKRQRD